MPPVIQLLGTQDDTVSPGDCVDVLVGSDFRYIEVPNSSHWQIIKFDGPHAQSRLSLIISAIVDPLSLIDEIALPKEDMDDFLDLSTNAFDLPPISAETSVDYVVVLVHGIRDHGFWTKKIGHRAKRAGRRRQLNVRVVSSSYGFFGMGPFFMPQMRLKYVDWFCDQYVTIRALYPNARIVCVAHSNGSYLLMRALQQCALMRFDRVVLAGSVVKRSYDLESVLRRQVGVIRNYVSTNDWVVATFPRLFEFFPFQDLGSSGHNGFDNVRTVNTTYVTGSHGAALMEDRWDEIAQFVLGSNAPSAGLAVGQSSISRFLSAFAPAAWAFLLASILCVFYLLILMTSGPLSLSVIASCVVVSAFVLLLTFILRNI